MTTPDIVVLASGRGSNFEAIANAIHNGSLNARITSVVSDRPEAPVLEKARKLGLGAHAIPGKGLTREEHEGRILDAIAPEKPRFLVLAGYMKVMTSRLIEAFRSERGYARIVNIHPSLLPSFPGVNSYAQAFHHGAPVTGVTVHLVELAVDDGPICMQEAFKISDCLSEAEVEERGLAIEHRLYPETLQWVLSEKFEVMRRKNPAGRERLCVRKN